MRALALLLALATTAVMAAPRSEPWPRWAGHGMNKVAVDHSAWDAFLRAHVREQDGIARLPYGRIGEADRKALAAYLERLQGIRVTGLSRPEQRAYWTNLYNAATVKVVLDHYPVPSILKIDISPGWFARGPWGRKLLKVENEPVSLDDIEHRILRPIWQDPRTHYAVNCASLGCPNLAAQAYTASRMEKMLDAAARAYVNHPRGARVANGALTVSSIYRWFEADFGGETGVLQHLRQYADPPLKAALADVDGIDDHAYDWALNEAK